ncbi:hypothetical protein GX51_07831 [Blastomyces parvus]|uniref:Uncharacterized protein n=1 Tax=Blastomyces parvus TaxID=2060905 RepID=A0A2B7WI70_9EURO|nr:hypothetical protein GX51_07831 [Blastomyces parvus]
MKPEIMKNLLLALPLLATVTSGRTLYARDYLTTREGETLNIFQGSEVAQSPEINGASFQNLGHTHASECQEQQAECAGAPDAVAAGQVQGQVQNQQADGQPLQKTQATQDAQQAQNTELAHVQDAQGQGAQQDDRAQDIGGQTVGIAGGTGVNAAQNAASTGGAVAVGADMGSECAQAIAAARRRRDVIRRSL